MIELVQSESAWENVSVMILGAIIATMIIVIYSVYVDVIKNKIVSVMIFVISFILLLGTAGTTTINTALNIVFPNYDIKELDAQIVDVTFNIGVNKPYGFKLETGDTLIFETNEKIDKDLVGRVLELSRNNDLVITKDEISKNYNIKELEVYNEKGTFIALELKDENSSFGDLLDDLEK